MTNAGGIAGARLQQIVDKIERLEVEKKELLETIKDVYGEAKSEGFDVKILRKVIGLRKMRADARQEQEELLSLYQSALGMA